MAQFAVAVKDIVATVVNRDYLAEACFTLLTMDSTAPTSPEQATTRQEQVKFCMGVIQSAQKR
ncbi:MAG TPA: hypothetical protein VMH26_07135 [Burkholderiales bacterium]|nr:hypothetical protein [Burkholderiales bacterium]